MVVVLEMVMNHFYQGQLNFSLTANQVVNIPAPENFADFFSQFIFPDFPVITNFEVWKTAFVMAIIASLETLLCVEATDKLDPYKRAHLLTENSKLRDWAILFQG